MGLEINTLREPDGKAMGPFTESNMEPAYANESLLGSDDLGLASLSRRGNRCKPITKVVSSLLLVSWAVSVNYEHGNDLSIEELLERSIAPNLDLSYEQILLLSSTPHTTSFHKILNRLCSPQAFNRFLPHQSNSDSLLAIFDHSSHPSNTRETGYSHRNDQTFTVQMLPFLLCGYPRQPQSNIAGSKEHMDPVHQDQRWSSARKRYAIRGA